MSKFAQVSYLKTVIISVSSYVQPPLLGHAEDTMYGSIKRNNYFTKDDYVLLPILVFQLVLLLWRSCFGNCIIEVSWAQVA